MVSSIALVLLACGAAGYAATPLVKTDFAGGQAGWVSMGPSGTVRIARDTSDMREGKPSLALDYEVGPKKFALAVLPVSPNAIRDAGQIHFWTKTEFPTSVVVTLSEKGGGNYAAMAWSPGGVWQEVRLEPRDFSLGDRSTDPPDPDGKLDLDQVQAIGVTDLAQLFGAAPRNPAIPIALDDHAGKHTLLISGFEVLGGIPPRQDNLVIDEFDAPQLTWSSPGGAAFRIDTAREHAPGPAMEVDYTQADHALVYFSRNLPPGIPDNITHISFDIASEKPAQFVFTLQERASGHGEGSRYIAVVEVRGKGTPDHRNLALRAFNLDPNGPPDPGGVLKIASAKSLSIADISPAANGDTGPNRFWISNIRFIVLP
jgi:hypothetical protein